MFIKPNAYLEKVEDITIEFLQKNKIKALILDVDNTLIDYNQNLSQSVEEWAKNLKGQGTKLYILSNTNDKEKVEKTSKKLDEAYSFVKEQAEEGKTVLFVGTKKQAQECMKEAAIKCGMYYVDQRWLGGMLTNFGTIQKRIQRLKDLETMSQDGTFEVLPKKEVILLKKEMEKLERNLGGIKEMNELPGVIFLVDPKKERIAILEAKKIGIPVVGLVDTNCNPEEVDYAIPGNDDAIRAVKLIADVMANAVIEGKQGESFEAEVEEQPVETEEATTIEEVVANEE